MKTNIDSYLIPSGISYLLNSARQKLSKFRKQPILIAIDGHSSSGKSTLAKDLASLLAYRHLDSGAMYRAVTLYFLKADIDISDDRAVESALRHIQLDFVIGNGSNIIRLNDVIVEEEIRSKDVNALVSEVSAISAIRRFLVNRQRQIGEAKGIVMDGRDIGTVVFPKAEMKYFVTASLDIRVSRRLAELKGRGIQATEDEVRQNLIKRDHIDSTRSDSPLRMAGDAVMLDTSEMDRETQLYKALEALMARTEL